MQNDFLTSLKTVSDPRIVGMTTYPLDEILLTTLIGVLCRGEDFDEIAYICSRELPWLREILPFKLGIAPAQTLRRVLSALIPKELETAFAGWVSSLCGRIKGVIAVDGKRLRGSGSDSSGKDALHIVSAYAHKSGFVLGQEAVSDKSNEITAIPILLKKLNISGCIVTIDAMGTQKQIARQIRQQEGDYLLALKGNQGELHDDVRTFFEDRQSVKTSRQHSQTNSGHGRVEERMCHISEAPWLCKRHPDWAGLRSIVRINCRRTVKRTGKTSITTRYYITSLPANAHIALAASRAHWSIENNLHWQLDVTFREDDCQISKDHAPRNLAMIRKTVLNLLRNEPTKLSLKRKRLKAMMEPKFRTKILAC